jgi:hypothetical protein
MWKIRSWLIVVGVLLLLFLLPVGCYLAMWAKASRQKGYSWKEMDWDEKGYTSISDFFAATDTGKREVIMKDGRRCTEYFAYKDGEPVKTVCPK